MCRGPLLRLSLSLPLVSTINLTRYPRADNDHENIRGPLLSAFFLFSRFSSFLSMANDPEIVRTNNWCRDVRREVEKGGGNEDYPKAGWTLLRVADYRKSIWKII